MAKSGSIERAKFRQEKDQASFDRTMRFISEVVKPVVSNPVVTYIGGILAIEWLYENRIYFWRDEDNVVHTEKNDSFWQIKDASLRDGMEIILDSAFIAHAFGLTAPAGEAKKLK